MDVEVAKGVRRIVHVTGEIDYSNVGELDTVLDEVIRECPEGLIIDLSETLYMDSGGVKSVLFAYQRVHAQGRDLAVVVKNPVIKEIFSLIHPERLTGLHMCDDISLAEQAIPECGGRGKER